MEFGLVAVVYRHFVFATHEGAFCLRCQDFWRDIPTTSTGILLYTGTVPRIVGNNYTCQRDLVSIQNAFKVESLSYEQCDVPATRLLSGAPNNVSDDGDDQPLIFSSSDTPILTSVQKQQNPNSNKQRRTTMHPCF